jgi:hypothetical protein
MTYITFQEVMRMRCMSTDAGPGDQRNRRVTWGGALASFHAFDLFRPAPPAGRGLHDAAGLHRPRRWPAAAYQDAGTSRVDKLARGTCSCRTRVFAARSLVSAIRCETRCGAPVSRSAPAGVQTGAREPIDRFVSAPFDGLEGPPSLRSRHQSRRVVKQPSLQPICLPRRKQSA